MIRNMFRRLFDRKPNATISLGYGNVAMCACMVEDQEAIVLWPAGVPGHPGDTIPFEQWPESALREAVMIRFKDRKAAQQLVGLIHSAYDDDIDYVGKLSGRFQIAPE